MSLRKKIKLRSVRAQRRKLLKSTFSQVPKNKKYPSGSLNVKILQAFVAFVFIVLFYVFLYYPYFQIKSVVVVDNNIVSEGIIEKIAWDNLNRIRYLIIPGRNIFVFDKQNIKKNIIEQVPEVDSVEVNRKFPDIIKVKIKEAEMIAIWQSGDNYFFLDKNGVVRGQVYDINYFDQENVFIVKDLNNKEVQLKENVLYAKHINFIRALYEKLPEIKINIKEVSLPSKLADEVHVTTENDWRIFFTLERQLDQQVNNLQLVFENEISNKLSESELDYVDMRVESWIYYRREMASKEEEKETEEAESVNVGEYNIQVND